MLNDSMKSVVQNFMKNKITDFRLSKGTGMQTETDARPQVFESRCILISSGGTNIKKKKLK